jgi:hypothetical protein
MTESHLWWRDGAIYQIYPRSFMDTTPVTGWEI